MRERRSGIGGVRRIVALLVVTALALGFIGTSVAVAGTSSISGTVRDAEGNPLPGVLVAAFHRLSSGTGPPRGVVTGADGKYTIPALSGECYKLSFSKDGYASQWWDKKARFEYADGILLGDDTALTSYDATLALAGGIEGAVSAAPGVTASLNGSVSLYDSAGVPVATFGIDSDDPDFPNFEFPDLQPGSYRLSYSTYSERIIDEYYDHKPSLDLATVVTVSSGATATVGITAREGATIQGRVTNETTGMPGVSVRLTDMDGNIPSTAKTCDATGNYVFEGLPAGRYQLRTETPFDEYVDEYYNDKVDPYKADAVAVSGMETKTIDFQLAKGGSIEGTLTGPTGALLPFMRIWLSGTTDDGQSFVAEAYTDRSGGSYSVTGIPKGKYSVYFDPAALNKADITTLSPAGGFAAEYWNDKPTYAQADKVVITGPGTVEGIDAQLAAGGVIKGKVTGFTGAPLGGIRVSAMVKYATDDFDEVLAGYSNPDGTYELKGLPAGTYIVRFGDFVNSYHPNGARNADFATKLVLAGGQTLTGIDGVCFAQTGSVRGRLTGADGKPAANVRVIVAREFNGTYTETPGDWLDAPGGEFSLGAVGNVKVRFSDPQFKRYADAVYPTAIAAEPGRGVLITQTLQFIQTDSAEGSDRFGTSVEVSKRSFAGAGAVIIATGRNWPDALGGAGLAGMANAPILLVEKDSIPESVMTEIHRLDNNAWIRRVYILGSDTVISKRVEDRLRTIFEHGEEKPAVIRLGGGTRYDTANAIATELTSRLGQAYDGTALVSTGLNYPDALAASPLAALKKWPLYLVNSGGVTQAMVDGMAANGVKKVIILGSTSVLPKTTVEDKFAAKFGAANVKRLAGGTRYTTALEVAKYGVAEQGMKWTSLGFATGTNFPDALSGGILQARNNGPMLLTPGTALDPSVEALVKDKKAEIYQVRFYGSTAAVSKTVRDKIAAARR